MTENDFDRTAQLWLEDGPTVMSDRALQAALDEIHVSRQRRAWWPARRSFQMNPSLRLAIGAAAVLAVAIIAINLLPGLATVGAGWLAGERRRPYAAFFDKATGVSPGISFTISQTFYADPARARSSIRSPDRASTIWRLP